MKEEDRSRKVGRITFYVEESIETDGRRVPGRELQRAAAVQVFGNHDAVSATSSCDVTCDWKVTVL